MEENNDFEKYDGHEESIETLLGTNEKSSSMTSRERVDDVLENEGAEVLSKYGVPKGLAKKVIKKDGGTFAPTHGPTQKLAKEYSRNKLAKGLDKIDSVKQKNSGYNKSYNSKEAFQRKLEDKNYYKNQINDAKNRQESASNNLDKSKENEKTEKKELKQAKKDERNAKRDNFKSKSYMASHPVEATEMAISNAAKKLGRKILIAIAPYAIGLILLILMAFFVIQLILGPIMEAWGYIDEAITGVANFSEKLTNFYYGFGFQDSKEAFYDELDELCDKYTCSNDGTGLDVPMLLATLFYTEGMGYDTAYGSIEDSDVIDKTSSGTNSGAFGAIKEWLREKYDESKETVDEDGLTYNAGKIYRLRKLARNQFYTNSFGLTERRGQIKTTTLSNFLEKYSLNIAHDISDMLKDFIGLALKSFTGPSTFNEVYAVATGSKYTGDYFYDLANKAGDFKETFKTLISDIFYGLADITDIKIELVGDDGLLTVNISYREFEYDEDNYKNYLTKYYFEHMPEFKKMLNGLKGENREIKKEQLFNDIKSNKNLFESIFLENISKSSENYVDSCLGAIDQNLVSELGKPVDIADNATISFSDSYSYGVVDGKNHNGVDLNETTSGVKLGSNVYSVSNGKIESIEDSKCSDNKNNCGKSIVISHSIIVNSKEFKFKTVYSNITPKTGIGKGNKISKGDIIGTIYNNTNNKEGLHFAFLDLNNDSKGVFIDPTNLFITCSTDSDGWLIHQSSISKSDFSKKLSDYCSNNSCNSSMQMFVNNADLIYDTAKKNNVSPELVVVRAVNEGFSPGNENGSNNYWGIGCTNTGGISACASYSSLTEGIKGFANISPVKNSKTATEMMSTYAYIGEYWYNPGSWSIGGCQYYPYINGYMSTNRSTIVGGYCEVSRACSGSSCNKTIDEDQQAYSKWQVDDNLIKRRKEIFGY